MDIPRPVPKGQCATSSVLVQRVGLLGCFYGDSSVVQSPPQRIEIAVPRRQLAGTLGQVGLLNYSSRVKSFLRAPIATELAPSRSPSGRVKTLTGLRADNCAVSPPIQGPADAMVAMCQEKTKRAAGAHAAWSVGHESGFGVGCGKSVAALTSAHDPER
jgi:hypothetical protein